MSTKPIRPPTTIYILIGLTGGAAVFIGLGGWPALFVVPYMVITGQLPWSDFFQFLLMLLAFGVLLVTARTLFPVLDAYYVLEAIRQELAERDRATLSAAECKLMAFSAGKPFMKV